MSSDEQLAADMDPVPAEPTGAPAGSAAGAEAAPASAAITVPGDGPVVDRLTEVVRIVDPAPTPIPGTWIDPPVKAAPEVVVRLRDSSGALGWTAGFAYRSYLRFSRARITLLAAGTTYYIFLALFSLLALAYGLTALFGADRIAEILTEALTEAFPGLVGDEGIDPDQLRSVGSAASIVGLLVMLYSGAGAMVATSNSIHLIYGAPPDPRNYVVRRLRLLGYLVVIGPLILGSLVVGILTQNFSSKVLGWLDWEGRMPAALVQLVATLLTLGVGFVAIYVLLAQLGGIRPARRHLVVGSLVGAVMVQALRVGMGVVLQVSASQPKYGTFTLPIGVLLVLYLNSIAIFAAASLTASLADSQ